MENKKVEKTGLLLRKSWLECLIYIIFAFSISFIFYLIFSTGFGDPDATLYDPSLNYSELSAMATIALSFVNSLNYMPIFVVGWTIILLLAIIVIVMIVKKKMNWRYAIMFALLFGVVVRLIYTNMTDNIFTRQHDVWSNNGTGHYGIIMHIFYNGTLPELKNGSLDNSYQMYHPKFVHYLYAGLMHLNSYIFPSANEQYSLYETLRIFTCAISIIEMYIGYLIMKELFKSEKAIFFGTLFIVASPLLIQEASSSNNDLLMYFFLFLAVLFAIRFFKHKGIWNIIGCAISVGLGMASKLSAALIAFPIGALFIYKFVREIIDNKGEDRHKAILVMIGYYALFLIICTPLGLYWPIYNMINYNQSFTYVFGNINSALLVPETYSFLDRYGYFSFFNYFGMFHVGVNTSVYVDYNVYADMMKTAIFGEYSFGGFAYVFCILLLAVNIVILLFVFFLYCYLILKSILNRKFVTTALLTIPVLTYFAFLLLISGETNLFIYGVILLVGDIAILFYLCKNIKELKTPLHLKTIFFMIIFVVFAMSFISFQFNYPYTCTHDFRYLGMFIPCFAFVIGVILEKLENHKNITKTLEVLLLIYAFGSFGLYASLL